jgi:heme exporter protein A
MSLVEVERAWKYFGEFAALKGVQLQVEAGQCLALLGRNGAGKTTLLRCLAGLSEVSEGAIRLAGKDPREANNRRRLAVLGHGVGVYDELTARENLQLFAKLFKMENATVRIDAWLARTMLDRVADHRVRDFSRGMRQRMAIARTFLHDPDVLILDEPFTSLDDRSIAMLQVILRESLQRGATILISTHQLREAMELATHIAVLDGGKVALASPRTEEILNDPSLVYRLLPTRLEQN